MRGVLRKEKTYSDRWNETLNCNLTEEFKAYRYLCEDMGWCERKLYEEKTDKRFQRYSEWENHINDILKNLSTEESKNEFSKFLSHKIRVTNSQDKISLGYIFPIIIALIGTEINEFYESIYQEQNKVVIIVGGCILGLGVYCLIQKVYKEIRYMDSKKAFFEDILEILNNMDNKEG